LRAQIGTTLRAVLLGVVPFAEPFLGYPGGSASFGELKMNEQRKYTA